MAVMIIGARHPPRSCRTSSGGPASLSRKVLTEERPLGQGVPSQEPHDPSHPLRARAGDRGRRKGLLRARCRVLPRVFGCRRRRRSPRSLRWIRAHDRTLRPERTRGRGRRYRRGKGSGSSGRGPSLFSFSAVRLFALLRSGGREVSSSAMLEALPVRIPPSLNWSSSTNPRGDGRSRDGGRGVSVAAQSTVLTKKSGAIVRP